MSLKRPFFFLFVYVSHEMKFKGRLFKYQSKGNVRAERS